MEADMSPSGKSVAKCPQLWLAGLVILSAMLVWSAGAVVVTSPSGTGAPAALARAVAHIDVATPSASGKAPRLPEFRAGHGPDDVVAASGPVRVPQGVRIGDAQEETRRSHPVSAPGLPQPRAPPLT
jgi:hypothetical protein